MVLSTLELERSARPTMTNAASPGRGGAGEVGGERSELRGHRSTPAKFCSSDSGCLVSFFLRCPVGAQRAARNDQQNLAAFTILASLHARAKRSSGALPIRTLRLTGASRLGGRWCCRRWSSKRSTATDDDERGFAWSGSRL